MPFGAIMAGVSLVSGYLGAKKSAKAAKKQANLQNEATERQFEYDNKMYDMTVDQMKAKHAFAVKETALKRKNDRNVANYQDAINAQNYQNQLMIRNREQASLEAQFAKSEELYALQTGYNERAADLAARNETRKLDEIYAEGAFNAQEQRLKNLQTEGQIRALGQSGVSVGKSHQAVLANFGQQIAALNAGLASAGENTRAALEEIKNDKFSADLAAWAEKMLDPGELPMPLEPLATPQATFMYPRVYQDYDFGPEPIQGAMISPSSAAAQVWGSSLTSLAGTASNIIKGFND